MCSAGKYCVGTGLTAESGNCDAGHYCPEGTQASNLWICPPGTYSTAGTGKNRDCTACSAGKSCPSGATAESACAVNHYCPVGTWYDTQFPCPDGTEYTGTDATQSGDCTNCAGGSLCIKGTKVTCPINHRCPAATTSAIPCLDGETAATGQTACSPCPAGSVCPVTQTDINPIACSATHMYMPSAGSGGPCELIPAGKIKATDSTVTDCPNGKWKEEGDPATTCTEDCPAGYFCAAGAKTPCTAGKFCAAGSGDDTTQCSAGSYCPTGAPYEIPCPSGYYSSAGATACTITTAGSQAITG